MIARFREVQGAFIGGESVPAATGRSYPVMEPWTGSQLATVARCADTEIDFAVSTAKDAAPLWRRLTAAERGRVLATIGQSLRAESDMFATIESRNAGKLPAEARSDVEGAAQYFEYYGGLILGLEGATIPTRQGTFAYTVREPYGVTGHIIPWNFPLLIAARSIAPALAAGNTVVAKPSEEAPLTCLALAQLCFQSGIPAGVFNVVPGFGEEAGAALASHPDVPRLTFTGSVETGRQVLAAAAAHFCYATVEMGGKSPNIVFADCNLPRALDGSAKAILTHAGQVCSAGSRLLVEEQIHDRVVEALVEKLNGVAPGPPDTSAMGPLLSRAHWERVANFIEAGIAEGATLRTRPPVDLDRGACFMPPVLFDDVTPTMTMAREEIFGPVLAVMTFAGEEEAITVANDSPYGLVAGVWTQNIGKALRVAHSLEVGTVFINGYFAGGAELPFGGYKASGFGREKGRVALEEYSRLKSVSITIE